MNKERLSDRFASSPALVEAYDALKLDTINSWVRQGRITIDKEGRRSERDCLNILHSNLLTEIERLKGQVGECDLREEMDRAKLRKLLLEGDIIEIQRDKERGQLINLEEAITERKDTDARIRTKLLSFPSRFSLELSGISDPIEIQKIIDDGVREVLLELHNELYGDSDDDTEDQG
jgi:hypothetical protein